MNSPNPVYHNSAYRIDSIGDVYNDGISNAAISYGSPSDSGVFSIWTVNSRGFVNVDMGMTLRDIITHPQMLLKLMVVANCIHTSIILEIPTVSS